jgi:hypothetical protein
MITDINLFKKILISGRYAFALRCVETAIIKEKFTHSLLSELLQKMWEFVYCEDLSEWFSKVSELTPESTNSLRESDVELISIKEFKDYKALYATMPGYLVYMIDRTWNIGLGNLYSDTGEYSYVTFGCLERVINMAQENNIPFPEITKFAQSAYDEMKLLVGEKEEILSFMKVRLLSYHKLSFFTLTYF